MTDKSADNINKNIDQEGVRKELDELVQSKLQQLDEKLDMVVRTYVYGTVSLTCEWVLGRYSATPGELAEVFELSLPLPLQPYLL